MGSGKQCTSSQAGAQGENGIFFTPHSGLCHLFFTPRFAPKMGFF